MLAWKAVTVPITRRGTRAHEDRFHSSQAGRHVLDGGLCLGDLILIAPSLVFLPAPWKDLIGRSVTGQLSRATFKPLPTSLVRGDAVSFKNSDTFL